MARSEYMEIDINEIELDVDNPRIKMYLETYREITAEGIALALNSSSNDGATSFSSLKESIRVNGGIIMPIIVNHISIKNKNVVIEGNTRLQIYKDFAQANPDDVRWKKIRCIVYTDMTDEEVHSIRLQSHLVGPRDWDPYSKAKYLDYLWNQERLPINTIISFCGGKKSEILKLVSAYHDMQEFYVPKIKELGYDFDFRDFSKFSELQNRGIVDALVFNGYTKRDFTDWVIYKNIDTAQNVRHLPAILKDKNAREEFLASNVTKALTKLAQPTASLDLSNVDYIELARALRTRLDRLELKDARQLWSDDGQEKRAILLGVAESIEDVLKDASDDEE